MALKKSFTDPYGCTHADAYWRLCGVAIDIANSAARVEFNVYHDAAARAAEKQPFPQRIGFTVVAEPPEGSPLPSFSTLLGVLDGGEEFCAELYTIAKGIPDFDGAEDC